MEVDNNPMVDNCIKSRRVGIEKNLELKDSRI